MTWKQATEILADQRPPCWIVTLGRITNIGNGPVSNDFVLQVTDCVSEKQLRFDLSAMQLEDAVNATLREWARWRDRQARLQAVASA